MKSSCGWLIQDIAICPYLQITEFLVQQKKGVVYETYVVPYFGGLKDSPTCLHSLDEVTYP
jgi:hypothetical protein